LIWSALWLSERRLLVPIALFLFAACATKLPDPPPAAQSHELPLAPPGARGARAGSLDPPMAPTFQESPDEALEESTPEDAAPATPPGPEDAGVTL
jgi:hypothetical protein